MPVLHAATRRIAHCIASIILISSFILTPTLADIGGKNCVSWDLARNVTVPFDIAFKIKDHPGFVAYNAEPPDVWSYFDRLAAANAKVGAPGFHEGLALPGSALSAVVRMLALKRSRFAALPGIDFPGVFVLLRGDSHLRIILNMVIFALTHDLAVIKRAEFNLRTYHFGHLFSCPPPSAEGFDLSPLEGCKLEIENVDISEKAMHGVLRERLAASHLCVYWRPEIIFSADVGVLQRYQGEGLLPDLIVADGGAHYRSDINVTALPKGSPLKFQATTSFSADFGAWLASAEEALEGLGGSSLTALVLVSAPYSHFSPWAWQVGSYDEVRCAVAGLSPKAKSRVSYLDLHTLAATDACGASSRFPAQEYDLREAAPAATAWRRATRT